MTSIRGRSSGRFISAQDAGFAAMEMDQPRAWEQFDVEDAGDGCVRIKAQKNGQYLMPNPDGNLEFSDNPGAWELWCIEDTGDGKNLKSKSFGKYLCVDETSDYAVIANRDSAGAWETFDM